MTIEKGAEIINSVVRGPTIIGQNTRIVNAYIGPFTSISHDCVVKDSEVERSIVLSHSTIENLPARVQDSLIGRHVVLKRSPIRPKALKLTLGDYSNLGLL